MRWQDYSEHNRRAWNEIAVVRSGSYHEASSSADYFRSGRSILDPRVVGAAGAVGGNRLLHLMCATGEETMSWSVLGASAVGVDISDLQVELAREKAESAGLDTRFVVADVGSLPADLLRHDFDIVYTATGVLVWLPDLAIWARAIGDALRPGGRFILWEEHPVAACFEPDGATPRLAYDYFDKTVEEEVGWGHFDGADDATETKCEFSWTLGDVITTLADAGLVIARLAEYPSEEAWRLGDALPAARNLPGRFLLVASNPHTANA